MKMSKDNNDERNHDTTSWGSLKKLKQMTNSLLNSQTNVTMIEKKQRRLEFFQE